MSKTTGVKCDNSGCTAASELISSLWVPPGWFEAEIKEGVHTRDGYGNHEERSTGHFCSKACFAAYLRKYADKLDPPKLQVVGGGPYR